MLPPEMITTPCYTFLAFRTSTVVMVIVLGSSLINP